MELVDNKGNKDSNNNIDINNNKGSNNKISNRIRKLRDYRLNKVVVTPIVKYRLLANNPSLPYLNYRRN